VVDVVGKLREVVVVVLEDVMEDVVEEVLEDVEEEVLEDDDLVVEVVVEQNDGVTTFPGPRCIHHLREIHQLNQPRVITLFSIGLVQESNL
jgi:hypothetical protein